MTDLIYEVTGMLLLLTAAFLLGFYIRRTARSRSPAAKVSPTLIKVKGSLEPRFNTVNIRTISVTGTFPEFSANYSADERVALIKTELQMRLLESLVENDTIEYLTCESPYGPRDEGAIHARVFIIPPKEYYQIGKPYISKKSNQ